MPAAAATALMVVAAYPSARNSARATSRTRRPVRSARARLPLASYRRLTWGRCGCTVPLSVTRACIERRSAMDHRPSPLLARLQQAINDHDLAGVTACFAQEYVN